MAWLTEQEKSQLRSGARRRAPAPPPAPARPFEDFLAFLTFASAFKPAPKPVRFTGSNWKL
jgi:hypothetical protein